jgi:hypothetical protein
VVALLILVLGGAVAVGLWSWLAPRGGRHHPPARVTGGRGGSAPGLRSARAIVEEREALEAEDLAQMIAAHNAWRRRRGRPERSVEDVEALVAGEAQDIRRRQERSLAQRDLDELLAATNARRRARGLPERDRDEVRRRDGSGASN